MIYIYYIYVYDIYLIPNIYIYVLYIYIYMFYIYIYIYVLCEWDVDDNTPTYPMYIGLAYPVKGAKQRCPFGSRQLPIRDVK